ncbi:MAG: membrane protein required for colicin V production [Cellvibrionaceae bacterium]|jgi:membrane protein required for colicin V production
MFNWADWAIIAILAISSLISLRRGFVKEALSLAIWIVALAVASLFSPKLAPLLAVYIEAPSIQQMAAFASLFVATLLVGGAVNYLLSTLIKATGLSGTDRLLGVLFGLVRALIVVMVILLYAPKLIPLYEDSWWQQSALIPQFLDFEDRFRQLSSSVYAYVFEFFSKTP